jgi:hypothetical protein
LEACAPAHLNILALNFSRTHLFLLMPPEGHLYNSSGMRLPVMRRARLLPVSAAIPRLPTVAV